MQAEYLSHVGAVRKNNEDAVYCDTKAGIFVVADGIGGKQAGEVASATAVRVVAEKFWQKANIDPAELMREAFYEANHLLHSAGQEKDMQGMGTTMTAALVRGDDIHLVHVGDSRAYLINRDTIEQLTTDHTFVNKLLQEGQISAEEATNHPQRNVLVRSIGHETLVQVEENHLKWQKGDYLLLCSDGLYGLLNDEEIKEFIHRAIDLKSAIDFMAQTAYNRGGYDNISVILILNDSEA